MTTDDLDTPALLIDVNILHRNLRKMAQYCSDHNALRPHTKTHKMPEIARLQLQYSAAGITVAKLGEAEVMADAGMEDILIVYPLWAKKVGAPDHLAGRAKITVAVDSLAVAVGISQAAKAAGTEIGIRAEFDTGFHCCGWPIAAESMDEIQRVIALPGLSLEERSELLSKISTTLCTTPWTDRIHIPRTSMQSFSTKRSEPRMLIKIIENIESDLPSGTFQNPEMVLRIMDRHVDWAVIIALVGGSQEIHHGEAGLSEWGKALQRNYRH